LTLARSQDGDKKPAAKKSGSKRRREVAVAQKDSSDDDSASIHALEIEELAAETESFERLDIEGDDDEGETEFEV